MQEDIKKIAESVFPDNNGWCGDKLAIPIQGISGLDFDFVTFNPYTNSADAFMVLEALIKKESYIGFNEDNGIYSSCDLFASYKELTCDGELKTNICTAYLSLIGDKE